MRTRLLLDTNAAVRWLIEPKRLSRDQTRELDRAVQHGEAVGLSAVSVLEIADLVRLQRLKLGISLPQFFAELEARGPITLLPISYEIGVEISTLGFTLPDPADRAIVATARVHRLRLVTSDERIVASGLVPTID